MEQLEVKKKQRREVKRKKKRIVAATAESALRCVIPLVLAYVLFSRVDMFSLTVQRSIHSSHRLSATGITTSFVQSLSSTRLIRPPTNFL